MKKYSKWNAAALKVTPAVCNAVCRSTATSFLTRKQNFFFPLEIREEDQEPFELVITTSVSDAPDNLSTAVGCYMHKHTFICWKLLVTCIFSGFQKQFLGAEKQDWILLLAGNPGLIPAWCQREQLWEQEQSWPLSCEVPLTMLEQVVHFCLPIPSTIPFVFWQLSLAVLISVTRSRGTVWIWWQVV